VAPVAPGRDVGCEMELGSDRSTASKGAVTLGQQRGERTILIGPQTVSRPRLVPR